MRRILLAAAALLLAACVPTTNVDAAPTIQDAAPASRPSPLRVYFVRHAESVGNTPRGARLTEEERNVLTPKGDRQAAEVAKRLKTVEVSKFFASPAGRAQTTSGVIAAARDDAPKVATEAAFGPIKDGVNDAGTPIPAAARAAAWRQGTDSRPQGGESLADVQARAVAFLDGLAKTGAASSVLVVSHGEVGSGLLAACSGKSPVETLLHGGFANASVHVFEFGGDGSKKYVGPLDAPASRGAESRR